MGTKGSKGTELADGTLVTQNVEGGIGAIRCPVCKEIATQFRRSDGQLVNKCQRCQRQFMSRPMK